MTRACLCFALSALAIAFLAGCGSDNASPSSDDEVVAPGYVLFNERWIEAQSIDGVDLSDPNDLFRHVFAALPDEVTVYPSENYYYFIAHIEGREIWGNLRLAAGSRENGVLSFGYFEFIEFPTGNEERFSGSKFFGEADGVVVEELDRFTYQVTFRARPVTFHLQQLSQTPPDGSLLGADEVFVQRTQDESGFRFYLLFNDPGRYFLWVLDEEARVPDVLEPLGDDLQVGRNSGFAFYIDPKHGGRKVLLGVRRLNITRNDYYDGPFDQLADNYADETQVSAFMLRAFPSLEGRIDKYGYYTDRDRPLRVALSTYYTYASRAELASFQERVRTEADPLAFISRGGRPETPPATSD